METEYFYQKVIKPRCLGEHAIELIDIVIFYRVEKRTARSVLLCEVATQITASFGGRLLATPSTHPDAARGSQVRRFLRKDGTVELKQYVWLSPWNGKAIEVRQ